MDTWQLDKTTDADASSLLEFFEEEDLAIPLDFTADLLGRGFIL